jgi:hypothetical protein
MNLPGSNILTWADDVLRRRPWTSPAGLAPLALARMAAVCVLFDVLYGAALGSFGLWRGKNALQIVYSSVKVPMLLLLTFVICLPSTFVLNTLVGLRRDFDQALRSLLTAQAALAVVLGSLAPITLFWYASTRSYPGATFFNGLMLAIAQQFPGLRISARIR